MKGTIHEITLTRDFVFVGVISWIVGSVKTLLKIKEIRPLYYRDRTQADINPTASLSIS